MFKAPLITLVYIFFLIGLASCGPDGDRSKTIVLYGFSSMENVMKEEISQVDPIIRTAVRLK